MVTPVVPGVSGRFEWGRAALPAFLGALAGRLNARLAYFVPTEAAGTPTLASRTSRVSDADRSTLDAAARQWLAGAHGTTVRLTAASDLVVDIAAVRGAGGESLGALLIARAAQDPIDREIAEAELELAAALVPSVLDQPDADEVRQGVLDWASAQVGGLAAFAVSVDGMAVVNDVLGGPVGDAIRRALLTRLERWAGPAARVVRAGEACYLAIRADVTDEAGARREAERLRQLLAAPVDIDGLVDDLATTSVSRSASIGFAVDPRGAATAEALLVAAMRSGAVARAAGGDRAELYDDVAATDRLAQLQLDLELAGAVGAGQLRMHYQPEFDLRSGKIIAVEGLLRWQHPRRGLLGAETFVPTTEDSHTFGAVQRWVIDECCRQLARWRAAGLADSLTLRLNVAAAQVLRGAVTDELRAALDRDGLRGEQVCVELTERRMPTQTAGLARALRGWREKGIKIAIDDFGTGDGTFTHLLDLPVDVVKVDQSFVARMRTDAQAATIVATVVSLAERLGLDVVAEGVDGPETARALLGLGCHRGQGNGLAEAQQPERIAELLRAQAG